jgi:hypothetical protein
MFALTTISLWISTLAGVICCLKSASCASTHTHRSHHARSVTRCATCANNNDIKCFIAISSHSEKPFREHALLGLRARLAVLLDSVSCRSSTLSISISRESHYLGGHRSREAQPHERYQMGEQRQPSLDVLRLVLENCARLTQHRLHAARLVWMYAPPGFLSQELL